MAEKSDEAELTEEKKVLDEDKDQLSAIHRMTTDIAQQLEKSRIAEYTQLLNRPWKLIWTNLLAGTARGVGIAIGFTFFAATIIYVLQALGALNLPIIGDYIADIVRIVQRQLELT
ncbi:hypothetical protein PVOR_11434 [Paenibacillus vortex V453]|jgi:hypothetical protein|uniref:Uncharacterized protein n=2 Tax=Paenibacillus TaxID=44249 RepID=A0A163L1X0_9BACL|nr:MULTISPECIES: DUF5665 domain-containing protein [Paenibacillus]RKM08325.1 hypothetical protein D6D84_03800 [Moraxella catarrhalis]ANA81699.1 hypothetical protein A3958_17740 [Paenibacillus glucanolyticus]AVV59569.1 hypothetical protein C7121_27310 [Paenibacillus glucanolyticus]EFU42123.1 hypothetical protein PVOR_11434 [Paenibacillus vortex V453]ETT42134.1 hypothetical protein C169_05247 [Paenibacillus sp. FSL R5-808]